MSPDTWLSDMSKCTPESALSPKRRKHHWQLIEYEAEEVSGTMLSAGPETEAPDVIYPLHLQGWHTVYVGIWGMSLAAGVENMIEVRLTDDPCFTTFTREKPNLFTLEEGFWKHMDLTGQDLVIRHHRSGFPTTASLAYVRLTPLTDNEVKRIQEDRQNEESKKLIAANDGDSDLYMKRPTTREGLLARIEPYRNTDFKKIFWEIGYGSNALYRSIHGKMLGEGIEDFPRVGDRYTAESIHILTTKGIDPLRTVMEHAHSMGLEFHVSQRIEQFCTPPPWEELYSTDFYHKHPELRLVDRDGTEVAGLSYAHPEVRDFYVSALKDAASCGADGAAVIYARAPPFILYEKPLIDGFEAEYGMNPRALDEKDERWLMYRATFVTQFMREVRQAMDAVGKKLGRRLETSAITLASRKINLFYGLDVEAWVKEGLIDNLIPYPSNDGHSFDETDMHYYASVTKGTKCKLFPNLMPRRIPPGEFRKRALAYYDAGADGLFFWDTNFRHDTTSMWATIRRLGHVNELKALAASGKHEEEPRTMKLLKLGGYAMTGYSPYRGT